MLAFAVLILYAIVIGIIATGVLCCCCAFCVALCCLDEDNENTNAQTNTSAQAFRRSLSNTSQKANAYLPTYNEAAGANSYRNFQGAVQRLSSIDAWRKPTTAGNSSSINPPTTETPERPLSTQNYSS